MEDIKQLANLVANEPQLRLLIDMIPEFIVLKDGEGKWLVTNKLVLNSYKMGENYPYQGKTDMELAEVFPSYLEAFRFNVETDELAWKEANTIHIEKSFQTPDGFTRTWEVIKTPVFNKDGFRSHLVIVSREITTRKKAEEALKISESKYRLIAENMRDMIITLDHNGIVTYLSPSFEKLTGYQIKDFLNQEALVFLEYIHPEDLEFVRQIYHEAIFAGKNFNSHYEYRLLKMNGQYIWLEANINTIYNNDGEFEKLILVARDIIKRKEYQKQLETMAYYDYLTGIPNRRSFIDQLSAEVVKAGKLNQRFALLYLDIDHFKNINDTMGHDIGDQLLIQFSERVQQIVSGKGIFSRIGGDEFAIIIPELITNEEAKEMGGKIVDALKKPWHIEDGIFQTTSSIGIAIFPKDGTTTQELIQNADESLYKAKAKGRANVHFYS